MCLMKGLPKMLLLLYLFNTFCIRQTEGVKVAQLGSYLKKMTTGSANETFIIHDSKPFVISPENNVLYRVEIEDGSENLYRASIEGSYTERILADIPSIKLMAYDWIRKELFMSHFEFKFIQRYNNSFLDILERLIPDPGYTCLTIDPNEMLMFAGYPIAHAIVAVSYDFSRFSQELVARDRVYVDHPISISIGPQEQQLYVADFKLTTIISLDYKGEIKDVLKDSDGHSPFALLFHHGELYWSDRTSIYVLNETTGNSVLIENNLYSADVDNHPVHLQAFELLYDFSNGGEKFLSLKFTLSAFSVTVTVMVLQTN